VTKYAHIVGWGKALPSLKLTNDDMAKIVDTSDQWIREHTGIGTRYICGPEETAATLSIEAGQQALDRARISAKDLDMIILATSSPDYQLPGAAFTVQAGLGAENAGAFDLKAGCSGFVYGLVVGSQFIMSGTHRNVLVIGAEVVSICLDWQDRRSCVLFGDGAGAAVLQAQDEPGGFLGSALGADGSNLDALYVKGAGSKYPMCQQVLDKGEEHLQLDGRRLLKFALRDAQQGLLKGLEKAGLSVADIDLFIPSQSNQRLLEAFAKNIGLPLEKVVINIDKYANTSAASVPIALCEALEKGRAAPGDRLLLFAYGAGLSWASAVVQLGPTTESPLAVNWPMLNRARTRLDRAKVMLRTTGATLAANASSLLLPFFTRSDQNE
jgi:3-oxoacyl-[acyl-carrier-protein] synthase-3